jgi:hypothetical protein
MNHDYEVTGSIPAPAAKKPGFTGLFLFIGNLLETFRAYPLICYKAQTNGNPLLQFVK